MSSNKIVKLWWWEPENGTSNFGDALSPYIVQQVSGKEVVKADLTKRKLISFEDINFAIGSILHIIPIKSRLTLYTKKVNVWGSGIIGKESYVQDANFYAVRGPKTRSKLLKLGYKVPDIYGDPALLLPRFYKPDTPKKYSYGIIPHYVDYELVKSHLNSPEVLVINLLDSIETVVQDILSCNRTISSSLHGVIVSHAYGVPSIWSIFSDKVHGDGFKFYDYYESVGINHGRGIHMNKQYLTSLTGNKLNRLFDELEGITLPQIHLDELLNKLLQNRPF